MLPILIHFNVTFFFFLTSGYTLVWRFSLLFTKKIQLTQQQKNSVRKESIVEAVCLNFEPK